MSRARHLLFPLSGLPGTLALAAVFILGTGALPVLVHLHLERGHQHGESCEAHALRHEGSCGARDPQHEGSGEGHAPKQEESGQGHDSHECLQCQILLNLGANALRIPHNAICGAFRDPVDTFSFTVPIPVGRPAYFLPLIRSPPSTS